MGAEHAPTLPQNRPEDSSSAPKQQQDAERPAARSRASDAPATVTKEQKAHLATHAKRGRANDSAARAMLWGHLLELKGPVGTTELSEAQATKLIAQLQHMTNEVIDATVLAAVNRFDDLPF